jgi:catechol 2,3-dioxygenase-like lactoylglutathione lyase family enzyme
MSNNSAPEVLGFDHAALSVSDLERSHRFYADVLGFNRVEDDFRMPDHELHGRVLVNPAGVRVELFEQRGSQPRPRLDPTVAAMQQGWFQFALSTHDVAAAYARVVAAGAAPLMPPRLAPDGRTLFAFVGDPDGNLVELLQRSPSAKAPRSGKS